MAQLKAGVGASDTLFQHERPNKPNRSRQDLSRITNFTADPGMIIPFDWFLCLPGDDVDIDFEFILDSLPLVNPSLTSYKVLTHWYAIDLKDIWEGFETFITRGRSGNVSLQIPQIDLDYPLKKSELVKLYSDDTSLEKEVKVIPRGKHSLASFLGVPSDVSGICKGLKSEPTGAFSIDKAYLPYTFIPYVSGSGHPQGMGGQAFNGYLKTIETGFNQYRKVSALPFMAYQNIVKYNYVNQNLLQDNHSLFPVKGDHDWFLPYEATTTNWLDFASNEDADSAPDSDKVFRYDGVFTNSDTCTRLDQLRYACFDDDYFTTGLPWLQRGEATKEEITISDLNLNIDHLFNDDMEYSGGFESWSKVISSGVTRSFSVGADSSQLTNNSVQIGGTGSQNQSSTVLNVSGSTTPVSLLGTMNAVLKNVRNVSTAKIALTANQLRELLALSVWQERNARVNGSYNAMIYQHWLSNPHGEEHKPLYIGGTADYVNFATILQSSESTSSSPLGSTAGRGSTGGQAKVGHYHANDYSYVFGIMIIKPNTTYMQGIEHHLTEKVFDDFVQPEFEGLSPQPVLNKEIFVSGDSNDEDLFCYQERYVYLKVRQNVARGMFQTKPEKDRLFGSFMQSRWFENRPSLSYQFLCMSPDNMRRDWLAYPSMPTFKIQAASKVFSTRSLSYTSQPNTFGF